MSMKFSLDSLDGQACTQARRVRRARRGVAHETRVHTLVRAFFEEDNLASAALFACYTVSQRLPPYIILIDLPGVPRSTTVPGMSCLTSASRMAHAIATPAIAMRL